VDRLLQIEVPVSVSLGGVQMRMKDVLALNSGSIVELEQDLGDRVEVRVNNCVIARGEMVAVEGNYGVRILEMVNGQLVSPGVSSSLSPNRRGA
jgi:flagellar motor switch protein FliN/FliY